MTVSEERTQRLPRDLVLITLTTSVLVLLAFTAYKLLRFPAHTLVGDYFRRGYTSANFMVSTLAEAAGGWALSAVLVWSLTRNFLDKYGAAGLSSLSTVRNAFAAVYAVLSCGYTYKAHFFLASLIEYRLEKLGHPCDFKANCSRDVWTGLDWTGLVLIVLVAFWVAILLGRSRDGVVPSETVNNPAPSSSRLTVALVCSVFFASLELWLIAASHRLTLFQYGGHVSLVWLWIVTPLALFALAFWGAWLAATRTVQVQPFRAMTAALLTHVLLQGIAFAIAWGVVVPIGGFFGMSPYDNDTAAAVTIGLLYLILLLPLMFGITRWLYRSLRTAVPDSVEKAVVWPS